MLLGSVIASTDAAAVFSILRSRGAAIIPRLRHLLELETGGADASPESQRMKRLVVGVVPPRGS
jgi:cell volume regulation protein A